MDPVNNTDSSGLAIDQSSRDFAENCLSQTPAFGGITSLFRPAPGCESFRSDGRVRGDVAARVHPRNFNFDDAENAANDLARSIADLQASSTCEDTLSTLGTSSEALRQKAGNVRFADASRSTDNYADALFGNSPAHNANRSIYGNTTVSQFWKSKRDNGQRIQAMTASPGNTVYIDPAYFNTHGDVFRIATLAHELVHAITGEVDSVLQERLGLPVDSKNTYNISTRLFYDCFFP
jgi:hypothetical protein